MENKEELNLRLKELNEKGYGKNDLARELECALIEYIINNMEEDEICKQDLENVANDIVDYIFDIQIRENLEDYIEVID